MCKMNRENEGELDAQFSGEKLRFISSICEAIYDHESKREQAIIEQSEKLQVFHGIFAASFFLVVPSVDANLLSPFDVILIYIMAISFLLSLGLTFFVQWRYRYASFPSIYETAENLKTYSDDIRAEEIKTDYYAHYYPEIITSLEDGNNLRSVLLKIATCFSFICILITLILLLKHLLYMR